MVAIPVIQPGSIGTYSDLLGYVGEVMDRDDLADEIPKFLAQFEAELNRRLRTLNQEQQATWVVPAGGLTLPNDFRRLRNLSPTGSPRTLLQPMSRQQVQQQFYGSAGLPRSYYLTNRVLFVAPNSGTVTVDAVYLAKIPTLSFDDDSNWVLDEHPDCYVTGACLYMAEFIRDVDAISYLRGKLDIIIEQIVTAGRLDRFGGGPLVPGGMMQVRGARC